MLGWVCEAELQLRDNVEVSYKTKPVRQLLPFIFPKELKPYMPTVLVQPAYCNSTHNSPSLQATKRPPIVNG